MSDERIDRDFNSRDPKDREELMYHSWCDVCQQVDLGMTDPQEYELHGIVFIEGRCQVCSNPVYTEIDDEF
jgi:hypothetical protein